MDCDTGVKAGVMAETSAFLVFGLVYGLSAGISPGPLLTIVITQSLRHGSAQGIKAAFAPLVTDLPIILLTVFLLWNLPERSLILAIVALGGSGFLFYLGYEHLRFHGTDMDAARGASHPIRQAMIVNALSPHPYLFWFSIGAPTVIAAYETGVWAASFFIGGFYLALIGSKVAVAVLVGRIAGLLHRKAYIVLMRILGLALVVFGVLFLAEAYVLFSARLTGHG